MASAIRPNNKQAVIASVLRREIREQRLRSGDRLPSYRELRERFDAGHVTVSQAVAELREDGVVESRGPAGVFVANAPSHVNRFGLVLPYQRPEMPPNRATMAVVEASREVAASQGCEIVLYENLRQRHDNASYMRAVNDVQRHRLSGLIFFRDPADIIDLSTSPLSTEPMPKVALTSQEAPGMQVVRHDFEAYLDQAAALLAKRGVRHAGVIAQEGLAQQRIGARLKAHGVSMCEGEVFAFGLGADATARPLVSLMLAQPEAYRPDGLLILDDHLLDPAIDGLPVAARRALGRDFHVVSAQNWPSATLVRDPITLVGFDAREWLTRAVDVLGQRARSGDLDPGPPILVPPRVEQPFSQDLFSLARKETSWLPTDLVPA